MTVGLLGLAVSIAFAICRLVNSHHETHLAASRLMDTYAKTVNTLVSSRQQEQQGHLKFQQVILAEFLKLAKQNNLAADIEAIVNTTGMSHNDAAAHLTKNRAEL